VDTAAFNPEWSNDFALEASTYMDTFYQTFGFIAAVCTGIIISAVFLTALSYFKRATRGFDVVKSKGFIKDGKLVNVYLTGGKWVLGVHFVGFTDQGSGKGGIPWWFWRLQRKRKFSFGRIL
jgi:hypothetical protein